MSNEREPLGYQPCPECKKIRKIYQGTGKRAKYLFANGCNCKMDQRTGPEAQAMFAKYTSKEDAQATLDSMLAPAPNPEPKKEKSKSSLLFWIGGGVVTVLGLMRLRG